MGLLFSTQTYLLLPPEGTWAEALRFHMPQWYIWGLLAPGLIRIDRRLPGRERLPNHLLMHIPLGVLWTFAFMAIYVIVEGVLGRTFSSLNVSFFAHHFYSNYIIYWLILGMHVARDYNTEVRQREIKAVQLEKLLAEARLHALQAQLHPHFLFNTLNAISAFIEQEPKRARQMMAQLGELLRFSLDYTERQEITLAEELAFLDNYLDIERARFEDHLTIDVHIDPEALGALVPSFLLQPLVENAIRHGVTARAAAGYIIIAAVRQGDTLVLRVQDNGPGLPDAWRLCDNGGVGLTNTAERLARLFGNRHRFNVEDGAGGGVLVEIELPFHEAPDPASPRPTTVLKAEA